MPLEERGGFPVHWSTRGEGAREVLLIHCSLAHQGAWAGLIAELEGLGRFTGFDLPGHGRSGDWASTGPLHEQALAIAGDFLDRPMDVVGHSFGAVVALALALERPERVNSLVMIDPVLFAAARADDPEHFVEKMHEYALPGGALAEGDRETATRRFAETWGTGQPWETLSAAQRAYMSERIHLVPQADALLFDDTAGLVPRLGKLDMPALLLEGERSPPVMARICDALERRIPDLRREKIAGAGHMLPVTHPAQTAGAIRVFWARATG